MEDPSNIFVQMHMSLTEQGYDAVAVEQKGGQITYRELISDAGVISDQINGYFREKAQSHPVVAVFANRSPSSIKAMIAVLMSGKAVLCVDTETPIDRIAYYFEVCNVGLVLADDFNASNLQAALGNPCPPIVSLTESLANSRLASDDEILSRFLTTIKLDLQSAAYVVFTSGSTGLPKGVLVGGRSLALHCVDIKKFYNITSDDRVLQFSSINFDISLEQILPTLSAGAVLVLRDDDLWTPDEFIKKLEAYRLTIVNLPTGYWHGLVSSWAESNRWPGSNKLKCVAVGGERMQSGVACKWTKSPIGNVRLLNAYGPAEATITSTFFQVPIDWPDDREIPLGKPVGRREIYILDHRRACLSPGQVGEIAIAGEMLAIGYAGSADLTNERFVESEFIAGRKERVYLTGDLGFFDDDGNLHFAGRKDRQVKVRGYRVEPEEIEKAVESIADISQCVILSKSEVDGLISLHAFIVRTAGSQKVPDIEGHLAKALPSYMHPRTITEVKTIPLNLNGKTDWEALRSIMKSTVFAPQILKENTVWNRLANIWRQILGDVDLEKNSSFFSLGGHSLAAMKLAAAIAREFGMNIAIKELFDNPTFGDQVSLLHDRVNSASSYPHVR